MCVCGGGGGGGGKRERGGESVLNTKIQPTPIFLMGGSSVGLLPYSPHSVQGVF